MSSFGTLSVEFEVTGDNTFTIAVNKASASMQNATMVAGRLPTAINKVSDAFGDSTNHIVAFAFAINEMREAAMTIYDVFGGWIENLIEVNAHVEKTILMLRGLSSATTEIQQTNEALSEFNQLLDMSTKTPFKLTSLTETFVQLKNANFDKPMQSLQAMSDAVAHFGGNDQTLERVGLALQQMAGKGVVSMEELRRQLGDAVPGALKAMASAMNLTVASLTAKVTSGTLESKNAIEQLSAEFERLYGGAGAQKLNSFTGQLAVLQTQWTKMALIAGGQNADGTYDKNSFFKVATDALKQLNSSLNDEGVKSALIDLNASLTGIAKDVSSIISVMVEWGPTLISTGTSILTVVAALKAGSTALELFTGGINGLMASKFVAGTGILPWLENVTSGTKQVVKKGALGSTPLSVPTPGIVSKAAGAASFVEEGGVSAAAGAATAAAFNGIKTAAMAAADGVASYVSWGKNLVLSLETSTAGLGLLDAAVTAGTVAFAQFAATAALIAAPIAIVAGLGAIAYALSQISTNGKIAGDQLDRIRKGDYSEPTQERAGNEIDEAKTRQKQIQAQLDAINAGKTVEAKGFASTLGSDGVQGQFVSQAGPTGAIVAPKLLAPDDDGTKAYKAQLETELGEIGTAIGEASALLFSAPQKAIDEGGKKIADDALNSVQDQLRVVEGSYRSGMDDIAAMRAKYDGKNDADSQKAIVALNERTAALIQDRYKQEIDLTTAMEAQLASRRQAALDAGNKQLAAKLGVAMDTVRKHVAEVQSEADDAAANQGKVVTVDANKLATQQTKFAQEMQQSLLQKTDETGWATQELGAVSYTDKVKAMTSETGRFALVSPQLKQALLDQAAALDVVDARYETAKAALKAYNDAQAIGATATKKINELQSADQFGDGALGSALGKTLGSLKSDMDTFTSSINANSQSYTELTGVTQSTTAAAVAQLGVLDLSDKSYSDLVETTNAAIKGNQNFGNTFLDLANQATMTGGPIGDLVNQATGWTSISTQSVGIQDNLSAALLNVANKAKLTADQINAVRDAASKLSDMSADAAKGTLADTLTFIDQFSKQGRAAQIAGMKPGAAAKAKTDDATGQAALAQKNLDAEYRTGLISLDTYNTKTLQLKTSLGLLVTSYDAAAQKADMKSAQPGITALTDLKAKLADLRAQLDGSGTEYAKWTEKLKTASPSIKAQSTEILATAQAVDAARVAVQKHTAALEALQQLQEGAAKAAEELKESLADTAAGPAETALQKAIRQAKVSAADGVSKVKADPNANPATIADAQVSAQQMVSAKSQALINDQVNKNAVAQLELQRQFADTLAERQSAAKQAVQTDYEAMVQEIQSAGYGEDVKQQKIAATTAFYEAKMEEAKRQTEGPLQQMGRQWADYGANIQQVGADVMSNFVDTMIDKLNDGTASWKDFATSVIKEIEKIGFEAALSPVLKFLGGAASSGLGGLLTSALGGGGGATSAITGDDALIATGHYHTGGSVGSEPTFSSPVPMSVFAAAKKYHTGGMPGLKSDEIPAILQKGEGVFTKGQMAAIGQMNQDNSALTAIASTMASALSVPASVASPGLTSVDPKSTGTAQPIAVNLHNQSNQNLKAVSAQPKFDGEKMVLDIVIKNAQQPGALRTALMGMK